MEGKKLNQILSSNETLSENISNIPPKNRKKFNFLKFQFIFCLCLVMVMSGYYFYLQYDKKQKEALSNEILNRLSITNLYENNEFSYATSRVANENTYQTDSFGFCVIGLIEINAIGINYPIINEFNDELLKIAPCKFFGPNPNQIR